MNSPTAQAAPPADNTGARLWPWALLGLAVCLIAISSQSFWIDEAYTARKAAQPTFTAWWHMMPQDNADLQMPFYMFYAWAFTKIFGIGEWTLRAGNIPWFIAGVVAFITAFPKPRRFAAAAVSLLCPFAWFYLNEARPYAMQLGASLVIFAALYRLSGDVTMEPRRERNWLAAFWLGVIVLCSGSILGVIWAGAAFLGLFVLFSPKRLMQLLRSHWLVCLLPSLLLAALAAYYIWTIKFGAHAVETDNHPGGNAALTVVKSAAHFRQGFGGGTDLKNIIFDAYELLGFTGLGPGRLEIRNGGFSVFRHFAPQLALYTLTLFPLLLLAASRLAHPPGSAKRVALALIALLPMLLLFLAGYFLGFRVLARHCTPIVPALIFVMSLGICSACSSGRAGFKILAGGFLALSLFSCLSLRFAVRHEKDDYRDAALAANAGLARGQKVWWSAADGGAEFYHVPLAPAPEASAKALLILNPTPQSLAALSPPDMVITSKPDLYDNQQALQLYLSNNTYAQTAAFPAFAVWQRKSGSAAP